MARPTENFAVRIGIVIGVPINMVGLPCPHSCTTPIIPRQFFPADLTFTISNIKAGSNNIFRESHFSPPTQGQLYENYSNITKDVNIMNLSRNFKIGIPLTVDTHNDRLIDRRLGGIIQYYLSPREDIDMRVPDEVRQCVVFIGLPVTMPSGQQGLSFQGTAFFVSVPSESMEGKSYVYLVTAKHVAIKLEGQTFMLRVNTKDGKSALVVEEGTRWWYHATDKSVDVALIPFVPPEEFEYKSIPPHMFLLDETIRDKSIGTGDEVFITGLFAHLTGSARNLPIVRMGNIAMMPGETVPSNEFGDIEAYLIEARSIGGLSGSPAFVFKSGKYYLLGLMHGHWDIPLQSKNDAMRVDEDTYGQVNMGIAIVIPAKKILEVLNQPQLIDARRAVDEASKKETISTFDKESPKANHKQDE